MRTLTLEDTVTSLSIDNSGSGYSGNLSASGGGVQISQEHTISSGIENITILDGGSGYT